MLIVPREIVGCEAQHEKSFPSCTTADTSEILTWVRIDRIYVKPELDLHNLTEGMELWVTTDLRFTFDSVTVIRKLIRKYILKHISSVDWYIKYETGAWRQTQARASLEQKRRLQGQKSPQNIFLLYMPNIKNQVMKCYHCCNSSCFWINFWWWHWKTYHSHCHINNTLNIQCFKNTAFLTKLFRKIQIFVI